MKPNNHFRTGTGPNSRPMPPRQPDGFSSGLAIVRMGIAIMIEALISPFRRKVIYPLVGFSRHCTYQLVFFWTGQYNYPRYVVPLIWLLTVSLLTIVLVLLYQVVVFFL